MQRMKMKDIKIELNREIKAVYDLKNQAFDDGDLSEFFRINQRLSGLLYCRALLNGSEVYQCYQTGLQYNSDGCKYTRRQ